MRKKLKQDDELSGSPASARPEYMKYLIPLVLLITQSVFALDIQQLKSHGGALIADTEPNHAFDHMSDALEDYIFLKKEVGRNGNLPLWEVVDHLSLGEIDSKDAVFYAMCNYHGVFDKKVVAIAEYDEEKAINALVKKAWIADIAHGKFRPIAVENVECINEGTAL